MVNKTCQKCGSSFAVPFPTDVRKYCFSCSPKRDRWATRSDKGTRKSVWVKVTCTTCGAKLEMTPWKAARSKDHFCDIECRNKHFATGAYVRKATGTHKGADVPFLAPDGYVRIYVKPEDRWPGRERYPRMLEHRWVMAQIIGRPLRDDEDVHHINGIRNDNRPENLELWLRSQPKGARVTDLLAWAHEIIDRYEGRYRWHHS